MQASTQFTAAHSSHQSSSVLRIRDVVKRFNVSMTTIRRATASGSLSCLTLPSGHRRFRETDVLEWLGIDVGAEKRNGGRIPIAAIVRVSSNGQNRRIGSSDKSSMEHQELRVKDFIDERWGREGKVTWYRSIGSGMNFNRKELLSLIEDVLAGKFSGGYIVATDFTRLCRFGIQMIEFIAKTGNCQIVYTMGDEAKDLNESLSDEILSILTHYTARASGAKNKAMNETKMDEAQLRDSYLWYKSGISYEGCSKRLGHEGRGQDGRGRKITKNVVIKRLQENWAALERLYANEETPKSSFELFVDKFVTKSEPKARMKRMPLLKRYRQWCDQEGMPKMSSPKISKVTEKLGWEKKFGDDATVSFCGLALKD